MDLFLESQPFLFLKENQVSTFESDKAQIKPIKLGNPSPFPFQVNHLVLEAFQYENLNPHFVVTEENKYENIFYATD